MVVPAVRGLSVLLFHAPPEGQMQFCCCEHGKSSLALRFGRGNPAGWPASSCTTLCPVAETRRRSWARPRAFPSSSCGVTSPFAIQASDCLLTPTLTAARISPGELEGFQRRRKPQHRQAKAAFDMPRSLRLNNQPVSAIQAGCACGRGVKVLVMAFEIGALSGRSPGTRSCD